MKQSERLLKKASDALEAAELLAEAGYFSDSISRAYYALLYAAEAALVSKNITPGTHKGVHRMFSQHFIKTGLLPPEMGRILREGYNARQLADYEIELEASKEMALRMVSQAQHFLNRIRQLHAA